MATDYFKPNRKTGEDRFNGYSCFKVSRDKDGNPLKSPKYVSFDHETLCGEYSFQKDAEEGFLNQDRPQEHVRKSDYKGLKKEGE